MVSPFHGRRHRSGRWSPNLLLQSLLLLLSLGRLGGQGCWQFFLSFVHVQQTFQRLPRRMRPSMRLRSGLASVWPRGPVQTLRAVREYQLEAGRAIHQQLEAGASHVLLHLPTGAGKTRVASNIALRIASAGEPVLWVAKSWLLLEQAADALQELGGGGAQSLVKAARIGGNEEFRQVAPWNGRRPSSTVIYTTLHTFLRRIGTPRAPERRLRPALIVWDEVHWAETSKMGVALKAYARRVGAQMLGLTATPRPEETSSFTQGYSKTFSELADLGFLATPIFRSEATNYNWYPRLCFTGDFSENSLEELNNKGRNNVIVQHYLGNRGAYNKTLVFASCIRHAEALAGLFQAAGVTCYVVHSQVPQPDKASRIDAFRNQATPAVLVNVLMLTEGFDVPDITEVFLCRPTTSQRLYMQMVGRGARRPTEDKATFTVVDFEDRLADLRHLLFNASTFLSFSGPYRCPTYDKHSFVQHVGPPLRFPYDPTDPTCNVSSLENLWIRPGQTFGVEIELGGLVNDRKRTQVARALERALGGELVRIGIDDTGDDGFSKWQVGWDASCGMEIRSRILCGIQGGSELIQACRALVQVANDLGLVVNHKCGLHVHLAWKVEGAFPTRRCLDELVKLWHKIEPGLGTLVAPSRLFHYDGTNYDIRRPNRYCKPVAAAMQRADFSAENWNKYSTLNLKHLGPGGLGTVEIRMHSGSMEGPKILQWVSLCMQILEKARLARFATGPRPDLSRIPGSRRVIRPDADIVQLAALLPDGSREGFKELLRDRRRQISSGAWREHPQLQRVVPSCFSETDDPGIICLD